MRLKHIVLISFLSLMIVEMLLSCAQIVAPTGGKKDKLAPVIVKIIPANQSKNFNGKQIDIFFDEYVSVDNIQQQLSITPNLEGTYETKIMPKGVRLTFDKPFKENTTYSFNFRNTFKDMNERNVAKNIRLVFSTGNIIDSLKVSGKVKNPLTNKPMMDVSVGMYVYSDTLNPKKIKPYYFMKTDSSGIFTIENVASGKYRIYAVTDVNNNLLYDEAKENLGIIRDTITLKSNLENLEINIARMEKIPNKVLKARTTSNYAYIDYYRGIKNVKINFVNKKDSMVYQQTEAKSIRIFNTNQVYSDTVKVKITVTDSLDRDYTHDQKIKFKEKPKKNDGVKEEFNMKTKPSNGEDIDLKEVGYTFNFTKPIGNYDLNKIEFMNDTLVRVPIIEKDIKWNTEKTEIKIKVEGKKAKEFVKLKMPKGTFISVENDSTQKFVSTHPIRDPENYGTIGGEVKNPKKKGFFVELLNEQYEIIQKVDNALKYEFAFVKAGTYYIRMIVDENRNGRWDTGDLEKNILPEIIKFSPDKIKLKQNFELTGYDFVIE
jgi:Bacterial Ig-like domain